MTKDELKAQLGAEISAFASAATTGNALLITRSKDALTACVEAVFERVTDSDSSPG